MNALFRKTERSVPASIPKSDNSQTAIGLVKYYTTIVKGPFKLDPHLYKATFDHANDPKNIDVYTNDAGTIIHIKGASGTVKIYTEKGSLLLIAIAVDEITEFNITHLKKGLYFIEAEKTFFEFVK